MRILFVGTYERYLNFFDNTEAVKITAVRNGYEAIKYLDSNAGLTDILISEYQLPGNDGLYLYEKIKSTLKSQEIPFVILQQEFNGGVYKKAFDLGIADYFDFELV